MSSKQPLADRLSILDYRHCPYTAMLFKLMAVQNCTEYINEVLIF